MVTIPNLREHVKHDTEVFRVPKGAFKWVHQWMDAPQPLLGKYHRRLFHDAATCQLIGMMGGPMAEAVCLEHIRLDKEVTERKNAKAREKYKRDKNKEIKKGGKL